MRILIVEDETALRDTIVEQLKGAGFNVDAAADGEEGLYCGREYALDLAIIDLGLPKLPGLELIRRLRAEGRKFPVLILTARDRWSEKVQGFDAGADDYVAKPFHMAEVLARLRALVRRAAGHASAELACGPVLLDTRSAKVTVDGRPVKLTAQEYRLLAYLMHHQDKVVSRTELTEHLYDQDFDRDSNIIEVFIGRLRKKLGADVIQTVRGLGYRVQAQG